MSSSRRKLRRASIISGAVDKDYAHEIQSITRGLDIVVASDFDGCDGLPTLLIWSKDTPYCLNDIAVIAKTFSAGNLVVARRDNTLLPPGLETARAESDGASAREAAFRLLRAAMKPEPPSVGRQEIRPPAVAYKAAAVEAPIERSFLKRLFLLVRGASVK